MGAYDPNLIAIVRQAREDVDEWTSVGDWDGQMDNQAMHIITSIENAGYRIIRETDNRYKAALEKLVRLKIGPKDSVYQREKPKAWREAAELLHLENDIIFP